MPKLISICTVYTVKKEYESEPEMNNYSRKKIIELAPRKIEGIGPTTRDGVPLVLRSVRYFIFIFTYE